jgi:hypothetical protein
VIGTGTKKDRDRETNGQRQGNKRTGSQMDRDTNRQDTERQGQGKSWAQRGTMDFLTDNRSCAQLGYFE